MTKDPSAGIPGGAQVGLTGFRLKSFYLLGIAAE